MTQKRLSTEAQKELRFPRSTLPRSSSKWCLLPSTKQPSKSIRNSRSNTTTCFQSTLLWLPRGPRIRKATQGTRQSGRARSRRCSRSFIAQITTATCTATTTAFRVSSQVSLWSLSSLRLRTGREFRSKRRLWCKQILLSEQIRRFWIL